MGSVSDKLVYLSKTKTKLYEAMKGLGYEVDDETTLREAVNMLWDASIEKRVEDFDVSSMPAYWETEMKDALEYLLTNYEDYDVHHLVVTDSHWKYNYGQSLKIVQLLQDTGLLGRVIHLGDITHNQTTFDEDWPLGVAALEPYKGNLLYVAGNHDTRTDTLVTQFYEEFVEGDSDLQGYPEELNYYWDDDTHKIRYIVLNTVINGSTAYSRLASFFSSTPVGYTPIILSHYSVFPFHYTPNDPTALYEIQSKWHAACDDFLKWVIASGKPCAAWIHGHHHRDGWGDWYDFGVVKSLTFGNDGHTDESFVKTEGTTNENAVAIMSISTSRREIKAYKIGQQFAYPRTMTLNWNLESTYATDFAQGFHMDTGEIESGREATRYVYTKPLPVKDSDGNMIRYYVWANKKLTHIYCDIWRANFVKQTRLSEDADICGGYCLKHDNANSRYFSLGIATSPAVDPAEILVTTDPSNLTLGESIEDVTWVENTWISSSNVTAEREGAAYCNKAINVIPGRKYHFWVDDPEWSSTYWWFKKLDAFAKQITIDYNNQGVAAWTEKTLTIPSNCRYVQIGANNLVGRLDKIHLDLIEE